MMSLLWTRDAPRWALTIRAASAVMLALTAILLLRGLVFARPTHRAKPRSRPTRPLASPSYGR